MRISTLVCLCVLGLVGCGEAGREAKFVASAKSAAQTGEHLEPMRTKALPRAGAPNSNLAASSRIFREPIAEFGDADGVGKGAGAGQPADANPAPPAESALPRKIIYTAHVDLVAENFETAEAGLLALIKDSQAYIVKSDLSGTTGATRHGTWTIRVPVDRYDATLSALSKLGELQKKNVDSQDVSDEFYDLDARIKNKKIEEERLLRHLDKSTGKLEDILAVEREITRVRGEVERMQGRMKYISQLSALTTITINILERNKAYVPPGAPSFATTISRTFDTSLNSLVELGKVVVLVAVAIAPWLPLLAIAVVLVWVMLRRVSRSEPTRPPQSAVAPAPPV